MTKPKRPARQKPTVRAEVNVHQDQPTGWLAGLSRTVKATAGILGTLGIFVAIAYGLITNFESVAHAAETKDQIKKERDEDKANVTKQISSMKQEFETTRLYGDRRDMLRDKKSLERKLADAQTRAAMKIKEDPVATITRKRDEQDLVELNAQLTAIELLINQMRLNVKKE